MSARRATKPKAKAKPSSGRGAGRPSNGAKNVAQIRELIFGEQMSGYEARFAELEKKLSIEVQTLKKSVEKSLVDLRKLMNKRTDEIEAGSLPRKEIADSLEQLAKTLRG